MRVGSRPSWLSTLAVSAVGWAMVAVLQAVASHADTLRRGLPSSLVESLAGSALAYLPWVPLTVLLFHSLSKRHYRRLTPRAVLRTFAWYLIVFYVPQVGYQVGLSMVLAGQPLHTWMTQWSRWPLAYWLVDLVLLVATLAIVQAIVMARASAQADGQRLEAIRGQLEPHFLFNALNAISALIRTGNATRALTALQQLSTLLRLVLSSSRHDWVTLDDELHFVREYVTMQALRFGERLRLDVTGDTAEARAADCPSLLLQPLVENAIRHGVEGHDTAGVIQLDITLSDHTLQIVVTNDAPYDRSHNPGLGVGLTTLRERLDLLYAHEAALIAEPDGGQFRVTLRLPRSRSLDEDF